MIPKPGISRRQVIAALLVLAVLASGVAAYTALFTAGAGTSYETSTGLEVSTGVDHELSEQNPFVDDSTIVIDNTSFSANGTASLSVDQFAGETTNLSTIDASSSEITIDPGDKSAISVSGGVTALDFEDAQLDATSQITYSADGSGTLTVTGLPGGEPFAARTTSGTVLTSTTTSSSGTAEIPVGAATNEEIILLSPDAPMVDNSSASPADGTETTTEEVDLSINVSDADFDDPADEVDATFVVDGEEVDTVTLSENGTASTTTEISLGGEVDWYVEVSDDYSYTTTSDTFTFLSPATLTFRSEQNPDEVLDNLQVNVTAYYGDETVRRNTSNGQIDLTNFPVDEPIIVRAGGENYTTRTAVIESIYDQSDVYLLNESVDTYEVRFNLQDPTGAYGLDNTVLFVERDLERNGSVEWRTIAGDSFGIQGVPVQLKQDERYRLRIRNLETGSTATIGSYTAIRSETVQLSPGSATIEVVESEQEYGWSVTENETGQYILFKYFDSANETDGVTLTIHERFNKSNVLVDNVTFSDANDIVYQEPLTANETNKTWMAEIYLDRGGSVVQFREPVSGPRGDLIPGDLGDGWRTGVGVFILLATGMMFSELNRGTGAIATSLVGGMLWQLGLLSLTTTGPAVVFAIAISVVYHYRGGQT